MKLMASETKVEVPAIVLQPTPEKSTPEEGNEKRKRLRIIAISVVVVVLIFSAAVVAAVYIVGKQAEYNIKTFQALYNTNNQGVVSEKITVGESEVKFQISGVVDAVLDFDKGLSMYMRRDEERAACLLSTFNASAGMAPKDLVDYLGNKQEIYKPERVIHLCYKVTYIPVTNRNFLSPLSKDMCNNVAVFWMINEECASMPEGRQKRDGGVRLSLLWGLIEVEVKW